MLSPLFIIIYLCGMDAANQEGQAFGEIQQKEKILTENTKTNNPVLSQPHSDKPAERVDNDVQATLDGRTQNKADKLDGDVLVDRAIAIGDQVTVNPNAAINLREIRSSATSPIIDCIESTRTPSQFFHRTLHLDFDHQPCRKRYVPERRYKKCTSSTQHRDNDPNCEQWEWRTDPGYYEVIQYESTKFLGEHWSTEDPYKLLPQIQNNQYNIIQTICLDGPSSKTYYGQSYDRPCWREKVIVALPEEKTNTCAELRRQGCEEQEARCTETDAQGKCISWHKKYRCSTHAAVRFQAGQDGIHCIDGGNLKGQSTKYDDMASSLAQLQVLSEIQKDVTDWTNPSVFKGQCHKCKKNILGNVLYDCCFARAGFAVDLGLTACNAEEQQLGQLRAEDKCHYVGSMPNQLLDVLWKSSDTHVYCCFTSKLIAIIQKEARKQLGKTFGTPQKPDCTGFTMDEITQLDFSKMDLSELFDDIMSSAKKGAQTTDTTNVQQRMEEKLASFHYKPKEVVL